MLVGLAVGVLAVPAAALRAQDDPAPWRLGVFFWHDAPNDLQALDGIRAALAAHGRAHELVLRTAGEDPEQAAEQLGELDRMGLDLVFAMGTQAALLCREHLRSAPVVFTAVTNPVESGVVPGWDGSGTRMTGNSNWIDPATVLEVFRMAVPGLARLGVLRSTQHGVVSAAEVREMSDRLVVERESRRVVVVPELVEEVVDGEAGLVAATERLVAAGVDAIWVPIDRVVYASLDRVVPVVARGGVPLLSSSLRGSRDGAVAGVVVDYEMLGERAVVMALRILEHGDDPAAMPIGRMRGYQVVVNLDAAARIGYELPLPLLAIADVIHEELGGVAPGRNEPERRDARDR